MRAVIDYRPALRERSGVGEYVYELVRALLRQTSAGELGTLGAQRVFELVERSPHASAAARRRDTDRSPVPGILLNFAWHRLEWPKAETLMGRQFDVTHSAHPLLLPARHAAQVVMIHDLNFLAHPERTRAEIRRDYPALARDHARRADRIVVPSRFTAGEVERQFGVPAEKIAVCPPGAPDWTPRSVMPKHGYVLFFGTLEPRKNVGGLLDAWERLLGLANAAGPVIPELVLAGKPAEGSQPWLDRLARAPLKGRVRHIGYVEPANRRPCTMAPGFWFSRRSKKVSAFPFSRR